LEIAVARATTELRSTGDDAPTLSAECRCGQEFLERCSGLFLSVSVNQLIEREVSAHIASIGHHSTQVTQMSL
jgi:hypothetical protein